MARPGFGWGGPLLLTRCKYRATLPDMKTEISQKEAEAIRKDQAVRAARLEKEGFWQRQRDEFEKAQLDEWMSKQELRHKTQ